MKHLLSIVAFVVLGAFAASAQDAVKGPKMEFKQTTMDYGTIEKGGDPVRIFNFTNVGNEPLVITQAQGSCGCTVPEWSKEPVLPGQSSTIKVKYDTQRVGPFTKQVTLTSNDGTNPTMVLTIKGEVKDAPKQESVPAGNGGIKQ
jgi:Protein of unknown function (DUF1573)